MWTERAEHHDMKMFIRGKIALGSAGRGGKKKRETQHLTHWQGRPPHTAPGVDSQATQIRPCRQPLHPPDHTEGGGGVDAQAEAWTTPTVSDC